MQIKWKKKKKNLKIIKSIKFNFNYIDFLLNENINIIYKFKLTENNVFGSDSILCNGLYYVMVKISK